MVGPTPWKGRLTTRPSLTPGGEVRQGPLSQATAGQMLQWRRVPPSPKVGRAHRDPASGIRNCVGQREAAKRGGPASGPSPSLKALPESSADHPWETGGADGEGAECPSERAPFRPPGSDWRLAQGRCDLDSTLSRLGVPGQELGVSETGHCRAPDRLNSRDHGSPLNGWRSSLCGALGPSGSGGSRRPPAFRLPSLGDKAEPLVLETRAPPLPAPVPVWSRCAGL